MLNVFLLSIVLQIALLLSHQYLPWVANASWSVNAVSDTIRYASGIGIVLLAAPAVAFLTVPPLAELGSRWPVHTARWALLGALALGVTARVANPNDATLGGLLGALSALLAAGGVIALFRAEDATARQLGVPPARLHMTGFGGLIQLAAVALLAVVAFHLLHVALGRTNMPTLREYSGFTGLVFVIGIAHIAARMLKVLREAQTREPSLSPASAP